MPIPSIADSGEMAHPKYGILFISLYTKRTTNKIQLDLSVYNGDYMKYNIAFQ